MANYVGSNGNDNFTGTNFADSFDMKNGNDDDGLIGIESSAPDVPRDRIALENPGMGAAEPELLPDDPINAVAERSGMSLTGEEQDASQVPVDAELFDASKSYRGEWVKYEDGLIGQAYTIEADFPSGRVVGALPDWIGVVKLEDDGLIGIESSAPDVPGDMTAMERFVSSWG